MITMATPLSAVSTTLDVSCLSCVSALHCIGLMLLWLLHWLCCCLSRQLTSDPSYSASLNGSLEEASSIAVM